MYSRYSTNSSTTTMLQSLNWEPLQIRRVNMHLCIIYKAYRNLAMFPLLDYTTLSTIHTRGHNIKFIQHHCSKDVYKHSFLPVALRGWNALPQSVVEAETLNLFKASLPGATDVLMLHYWFYLAPCGWIFVKCTFFFLWFSFLLASCLNCQCWWLEITGR